MTRPLVFLASIGHSGSTLLELLLGAHPRIVGLGEVAGTIAQAAQPLPVCTCGQPAEECPIWGPVVVAQRKDSGRHLREAHGQLLDRVTEVYGPDHIPIDASKNLDALKELHSWCQEDLRIILLLKDVRSFMVSLAKLPDRQGAVGFRASLRRSVLLRALQWYRGNRAYLDFFAKHDLSHFQIGYEEFCFRTEDVLAKLCEFIGVEPDERMLTPQVSQSHIVHGNRMRLDPDKRRRIVYDNRWFHDWRVQLVAAGLPWLMRWNSEQVYTNLRQFPIR